MKVILLSRLRTSLKWLGISLLVLICIFSGFVVYWFLRPNTSFINKQLNVETWDVINDGSHNSNTDLILWKGSFFLIYASSPLHWGTSASKLVIKKSIDGELWETVTELNAPGEDIRDPKFAIINDKLFLYALKNAGIIAAPYTTVYSVSNDGETWEEWKDINYPGWLFWRPKTFDGLNWYMPAYWHEHGGSALFKSTDGINWHKVSDIYHGDANDETAIEFLPDGRIICTARLEGLSAYSIFGDITASTLIAVSDHPYTNWTYSKSYVTRLDGPYLFSYSEKTYAIGRFEPESKGVFSQLGSFFCKKKTALFLLEEDQLVYLSDLPSAGDTSYVGLVMKDGLLYATYYSSDITKDFVWLMGQLSPSNIRMARINLEILDSVSNSPPILTYEGIPLDNLVIIIGIVCVGVIIIYKTKERKVRMEENKLSIND